MGWALNIFWRVCCVCDRRRNQLIKIKKIVQVPSVDFLAITTENLFTGPFSKGTFFRGPFSAYHITDFCYINVLPFYFIEFSIFT